MYNFMMNCQHGKMRKFSFLRCGLFSIILPFTHFKCLEFYSISLSPCFPSIFNIFKWFCAAEPFSNFFLFIHSTFSIGVARERRQQQKWFQLLFYDRGKWITGNVSTISHHSPSYMILSTILCDAGKKFPLITFGAACYGIQFVNDF